jgi:hypothetical protein
MEEFAGVTRDYEAILKKEESPAGDRIWSHAYSKLSFGFKLGIRVMGIRLRYALIFEGVNHTAVAKWEGKGSRAGVKNEFTRCVRGCFRTDKGVASMSCSLKEVENVFLRKVVGKRRNHSNADSNSSLNVSLYTLGMVFWWRCYECTTNGAKGLS